MIKFVIALLLTFIGSSIYAGECANGNCMLRSRVVNVTREVVSVPVVVTRRTVDTSRVVGRRNVVRVRNVVR